MRNQLLGLMSLVRGERGIATLQIGLLSAAPLLVGAVFAASVMNTGTLSTGQFEWVARSAMRDAGSGIVLRGSSFARTDGTSITHVVFLAETAPGGQPVDLDPLAVRDRTVASYMSKTRVVRNLPFEIVWISGDGDSLLEPGEIAEISVDVSAVVSAGEGFTIEIRPPYGLYATGYVPPQPGGHLNAILPLR